jgi:hypothetical protein
VKLPGWIATPSIGITDPVLDSPQVVSGVEGNTQLTSFVLRVLLAVEGFTISSVRQIFTLHAFLELAARSAARTVARRRPPMTGRGG